MQSSRVCGCFYCLKTFPPSDIDKGETALCPNCGIDTVIGSKSGYKITVGFLRRMCKKWFSV